MEHEQIGAARLHPDGVATAISARAAIASATSADRALGRVRADLDRLLGAVEIEQPIWPRRGLIVTSGGSPASRARVMRSCMMLKASTITLGDARRARAAEQLPLEQNVPGRENAAQARRAWRGSRPERLSIVLVGAVTWRW